MHFAPWLISQLNIFSHLWLLKDQSITIHNNSWVLAAIQRFIQTLMTHDVNKNDLQ